MENIKWNKRRLLVFLAFILHACRGLSRLPFRDPLFPNVHSSFVVVAALLPADLGPGSWPPLAAKASHLCCGEGPQPHESMVCCHPEVNLLGLRGIAIVFSMPACVRRARDRSHHSLSCGSAEDLQAKRGAISAVAAANCLQRDGGYLEARLVFKILLDPE